MATEPQHSETMSGAPASSEPADVGANAALILAALSRIEAVVRDERAALASLRTSLGDMAQAIARAKAVADSENAAAMLDEFEHRVDAMIEIAGAAPAPEPAAESDQVPTVADVVLRLGPGETQPAVANAEPPAVSTGDKGPTVAMLTAMVEALSASIQTPEPEAEVAAPPASEPAPEFTAWPVEAEATAMTEPESTPAPEAAPASLPGETLAQESTLLASFEQMESRPFPPPEEGTAVIFTSNFVTSNIFTSKIEPANLQAERGFAPPAPPEPAAAPDPAPTAPAETAAPEQPIESAPAAARLEPAVVPEPTLTAATASAPDVVAVEPEAAVPPSEAPAETKSAEAYFDPTDFLFGPEPEPDPAAFLLDPAPPRTHKPSLPQPEFVAPPSEPPQTEPPNAEAPLPAQPDQLVATTPKPHDPLHALKAMSPNEKIAIFS